MVIPRLKLHGDMDFASEPPWAVNTSLWEDAFGEVWR